MERGSYEMKNPAGAGFSLCTGGTRRSRNLVQPAGPLGSTGAEPLLGLLVGGFRIDAFS